MNEEERELLELLLGDQADEAPTGPAVSPGEPAPLTLSQRRLWFLQRLDASSTAYNIVHAFGLRGTLDVERLRRTFGHLIERHAILRSRIVELDGVPWQRIEESAEFDLRIERAQPERAANRDQWVRDLLAAQAAMPFDAAGPFFRVSIHAWADDDHLLVLSLHHLVSDAWSNAIWLRELSAAWRAEGGRQDASLAALPIQYADHARREAHYLQSPAAQADLDYWRTYLGTSLAPLNLPADRPYTDKPSRRAGTHAFLAEADIAARVSALCAAHALTPFTVCFAAFQLVLARFCQQKEFFIGVPEAGRHSTDLEHLIGCFVNTHVYRARPEPAEAVLDWLKRIQRESLDAMAHPALPLERLLDALPVDRSSARHPLFQVTFGFHGKQDLPSLELEGLAVEPVAQSAPHEAKFELTLHVGFDGSELSGVFEYDADLFDAQTIERLAGYYRTALDALVADPSHRLRAVGTLDVLGASEVSALRARGQGPGSDAAGEPLPVHRLIEHRAAAEPDAVALVLGAKEMSYGELNRRANRLAHALIARGVGPEVTVGLAAGRSMEMIVGLLAVLKAGGAYVPLDPEYPPERLAYMIGDSGLRLLLAPESLRPKLPGFDGLAFVALAGPDERDDAGEDERESRNPDRRVAAGNLAYVVYTSGSTGQPKGVAVAHGPLAMHCRAISVCYDVQPGDRELQFFSMSFDAAAEQWMTPLINGAAIVIRDAGDWPPDRFLDEVRERRVSILHLPPAYVDLLPAEAGVGSVAVKTCIVGGEGWQKAGYDAVRRQLKPARIVNAYGPAETVITPTAWVADAHRAFDGAYAPIGVPVGARCVYVLDDQMNLVADGQPGELYIGGFGVARGYLGRPGLTASRFVADPFDDRGGRLYRTGDLVRWLADGSLDYLGRLDHQVKIRGFRIELGEVESALLSNPAIREAVVVPKPGPLGPRLVAYVTAASASARGSLDTDAVRQALARQLPAYMVPGAIVELDALPLNPNGKVDRNALPEPADAPRDYEAPRGPAEQALAEAWQEVLGLEAIGRADNFFELGGDSILSLQIVARARQSGWKITPRQLFDHQTIAGLGAVAQPLADERAQHRAAPDQPVPLLPIQHMFFSLDFARRSHWNQAVLLATREPVDRGCLAQALRAVMQRHGALRLRFARDDSGNWSQRLAPLDDGHAGELPFRERKAATSEAITACCDEAQRSLDIERGPLLRAVLIEVADGSSRLLLAAHHLAVDGVSWRILLADLQHAYGQALRREAIALPASTSAYETWAQRLRDYAQTAEVLDEIPYWQAQLAVSPQLPAPLPAPLHDGAAAEAGRRCDVASVQVRLDRAQTARLLQSVPKAYRTQIDDALLAALAHALCDWTQREAVRIDVERHGREDLFDDVDLSSTVGWFTCVHPLALASTGDLLHTLRVTKEALRAVPHKGIGYGLLRALAADSRVRALDGHARSEVSFNYLGQFDRGIDPAAGWTLAEEAPGGLHDAGAPLLYPLSVGGQVYDGELAMTFEYSVARYGADAIGRLAEVFRCALCALIEQCAGQPPRATPSDFPLAGLTLAELDALPLDPGRVEDIYPLAPMQAGLLFHASYDPHDTAYRNQLDVDLEGLDVPRFRDAWHSAVTRHAILRTGFLQRAAGPLQWVSADAALPFVELDWRGTADLDAALRELAQRELDAPFDLACPPLFRFVLVRTAERMHRLIWTHHHLLLDGWSTSLLLGDVLRAYAGGAQRNDGAGRYRDYIAWLGARDRAAGLDYWKRQVLRIDEPTRLASALPSPALAQTGARGEYRVELGRAVSDALATYARRERVTVNTLVQGAWAVLLQRYTRQRAVVFGATVSGRPPELPHAERMLGLFINTLPVVLEPRAEAKPGEWLRAAQDQALAMREYEQTPLGDIHKLAGAGRHGLFDTLVVFENYPVDEALNEGAPLGLDASRVVTREETHYPLALSVAEAPQGLTLRYDYAADRFDAARIEAIARQFRRVLEQMPEARRLADLDLNDCRDEAALRVAGDNPQAHDGTDWAHVLIAAQAQATPDAIAVTCGAQAITYRELEARSNRLAQRLVKFGVGPEVRVGIAVERSVEMVIGLLAILKAGGAYVPLDPEYPRERLAYMLEDSGVALLLTQSRVRERLPLPEGVTVLELDTVNVSDEPAVAPRVTMNGENLAYVIYTSGSTGRPKGVMVRHDALRNFLCGMQARPGLTRDDVLVSVTSLSFDIAALELYLPLTVGARVVVAPREATQDGAALDRLLDESGATVMQATPATWRMLLAADWQGRKFRGLCGGEALTRELGDALRGLGVDLWNMYGPTETTIWSSSQHVDGRPCLGEPISATRLRVLDAALNLAPAGVAGELYIGGAGVARGYLNRAALSAERFVPDPFDADGGRLYRTGDLVRWNAAGELEYLGRLDHQVKIRGFRIELGEVEAQLLAQPEVREAVVTAQEGAGGARLVGYVTAHAGHTLEPQVLRASLTSSLPEYMVPGVIVVLEALPLTPNGKIDRNALPAPEYPAHGYEAPQDGTEETLARVWGEVLGVERVGRHDNFFELGGDSILSLKVVARAHEAGLRIAPRQVFDAQTVAALAAALATAQDDGVPPLRPLPADERQALPLSHAQQRLWFLWNLQRGSSAYHMAGALRLRGGLDVPAVRASFGALVSRHESLRTTFAAGPDGQATQTIGNDARFDWREIDLGDTNAQQNVEETCASLATEPFDLTTGPLLRVGLLRVRADEHVLVVSMHHIVSDGWSVDVLLREFVAGYRARVTGEAPDLPPLLLQYADYAVWQHRWLEAGERERQLAYWRETLGEEQPVLVLPADHPRQAVANYHAAALELDLPAKLGEAVHRTARAQGTTPFVVLLSAYAVLLHRYSGQPDIRVGVPVANRDRVETAGLIGLFVNTQVLRTQLEGSTMLAALLGQVKAAARGAQAHQDLPFDVLVEALQPQRSLSHTPLFQVMFNHLRDDERSLETLPGVSVQWESPGAGMAQFELTLTTAEEASGALSASLVYARELFDARTMAQFGRHYVAVLEALTGGDVGTVAEVALLSAQERAGLVAQGARTEQYADVMPVHEWIAREAQAHPERVAVVYGETQLRYGELDAQANRLAQRLAKLGVGPEVRVGIAVERSVEMVVGLLAILKAGGAYVPMDPEYPRDRLAYMLEDSGVALLLTQSWVRERLPVAEGVTVLELDTLDVSAEPAVAPQISVHGENLAYVIYTSGSTGRPKGAANRHSALSNRLAWMQSAYALEETDVVLQKTPFSFDVSVWEFFWPLMVGARLAVAEPGAHRDPQRLVELIRDHGVTTLHFVPSMLQAFVAHEGVKTCAQLKRIICSGEALPADLATRTLDQLPGVGLYNLYGPTEAAIDVTHWTCRPADEVVPIGRPIGNVSTHVLDAQMNLVPRGVAGELYLGGVGLARGYLNRAALTAERFVPDPFDANGGRLYRTGDLARWTNEGALEYLGRIDHQVKVRGLRIELGEIEAQLAAQAEVREAVVTAKEGPGGTRLIAYVTAHADHTVEQQALREALLKQLPDYMVPSAIMVLEALPLNPNGKVDRKALPTPEYQTRGYEPPQGETEEALAQIWSEVLGIDIERISRTDNFFELGGHSLTIMQVQQRLLTRLGLSIPLSTFFVAVTLEQLAQACESSRAAQAAAPRDELDTMRSLLDELADQV
ncbi:non-ribosomal peptide synthetase [Paraburkholderia sp. J12]|uniref:non-ribosomal peptide synthetase n=1 Tax=Paraburkholderia sp. J12 TaxID=2805432 RepID=UPI002ABE813C|nr:non-ribosomal peptide synthetase [Paraburkholderia sp. J12]